MRFVLALAFCFASAGAIAGPTVSLMSGPDARTEATITAKRFSETVRLDAAFSQVRAGFAALPAAGPGPQAAQGSELTATGVGADMLGRLPLGRGFSLVITAGARIISEERAAGDRRERLVERVSAGLSYSVGSADLMVKVESFMGTRALAGLEFHF